MARFIPPNNNSSYRLKILIVDDLPLVLTSLKRDIKKLGHEAIGTTDPLEALKILQFQNKNSNNPSIDLIITDYKMPKMNGLTLIQKIKENNIKIKILMFTIEGKELDLKRQVLNENIYGFIDKDPDEDTLQYTIASILEEKKIEHSIKN